MARYLATIPNNTGFYNLGTVESYPTGGAGPTAYGPTSYFGSDPLPEQTGDNIYNPIDPGDFSSAFRSVKIDNTHGGLSRKQTTFYQLRLDQPRSIQFTQNYSQFSYEEKTNRNTLLAFYKITDGNHREELPINDLGYVSKESSIDYLDDENNNKLDDYPSTKLPVGTYLFLITNDIRYLETTYSISINVDITDWGLIKEAVTDSLDFGRVSDGVVTEINFGSI